MSAARLFLIQLLACLLDCAALAGVTAGSHWGLRVRWQSAALRFPCVLVMQAKVFQLWRWKADAKRVAAC